MKLFLVNVRSEAEQGQSKGWRIRITYYLQSWTAIAGPFCFLGFYCKSVRKIILISIEIKFSKGALIHTLYQTFPFIISILGGVTLRGKGLGQGKVPPSHSLAAFLV